MHSIEPSSFCTVQEYKAKLEQRLQATELYLGQLYLALAVLKKGMVRREAFKFPVSIAAIDLGDSSKSMVTVNLLDHDFKPTAEVSLGMEDGTARNPNIKETTTNKNVREMYLKGYEDTLRDDLLQIPMVHDMAWDELGGDLMPSPLQVIH